MRSNHLLVLSGALALGLIAVGCSKNQDAAPTGSPSLAQSEGPPASQSQEDREAYSQLQDLRLQVDAYEKIYKHKPNSLEQMINEGFLNKLPAAPPGKRFAYDPATASVSLVPQ